MVEKIIYLDHAGLAVGDQMIKEILSKGSLEVLPVEVEHGMISWVQGEDMNVAWGGLHHISEHLVDSHKARGVPPWDGAALRGSNEELKQITTNEN